MPKNKAKQSEVWWVVTTATYTRKQWQTVSMDLIVALPPTLDGNTSLVVFVDNLTKMIHTAPCVGLSSEHTLADLFLKNVFRYHGMPTKFISDRDPRFNSAFWKEFVGYCKVTCKMSSAFHPETDGQTEIVNKSIENYLHHFVAENQDDRVCRVCRVCLQQLPS